MIRREVEFCVSSVNMAAARFLPRLLSVQSSAAASSAPKPMTVGDVAVSTLFGGFFLALSVVDSSVGMWARADWAARGSFLSSYFAWRHDAPLIGPFMLLLLLILPFAVWGMIKDDVLPLLRGAAPEHRARHAWGAVNFVGLLFVIFYAVAQQRPAELAVIAGGAGSEAAAQHAGTCHAVSLVANLVMALLPMFKFAAASKASAAATAVAVKKE